MERDSAGDRIIEGWEQLVDVKNTASRVIGKKLIYATGQQKDGTRKSKRP